MIFSFLIVANKPYSSENLHYIFRIRFLEFPHRELLRANPQIQLFLYKTLRIDYGKVSLINVKTHIFNHWKFLIYCRSLLIMLSRDRMLTALRRGQPDRVPMTLGFFPMILPQTPNHDPDEYFKTDIRYITFKPLEEENGFLRYLETLPKHIPMGSLANLRTYWEWSYHPETPGAEPLAAAQTIEELDVSLLPKITDPSRYRNLSDKVRTYQDKGLAVIGIPPHLGGMVFETAWRLRGFQQFLLDLRRNRELANYLFDQLTAMLVHNAVVLARAGVDILCLNDDVGAPTSMIISPSTWREFLKPHDEGHRTCQRGKTRHLYFFPQRRLYQTHYPRPH